MSNHDDDDDDNDDDEDVATIATIPSQTFNVPREQEDDHVNIDNRIP
jgi:hypothetical protein